MNYTCWEEKRGFLWTNMEPAWDKTDCSERDPRGVKLGFRSCVLMCTDIFCGCTKAVIGKAHNQNIFS